MARSNYQLVAAGDAIDQNRGSFNHPGLPATIEEMLNDVDALARFLELPEDKQLAAYVRMIESEHKQRASAC